MIGRSLKKYIGSNVLMILLAITSFQSASMDKEDISIEDGYVRATIPGTQISSAYMRIVNNTNSDKTLVAASSKISDRIEIHQHIMADGMMKMRKLDKLGISANESVLLQPSSYHLMIFNLSALLKPKTTILVTLHFQSGESINVELPVKSIKDVSKKAHHHSHH